MQGKAFKDVFESTRDIANDYLEPKQTKMDFAQAASDGFTKAVTVATVSLALGVNFVGEKIKERKKKDE